MRKKLIKLLGISFIMSLIFCAHSFAMPTNDFDAGMKKGIEYFDKQMYYEARDEFQWFCDYNWGSMNDGQRQYALDYLGGTKLAIFDMECSYVPYNEGFRTYKNLVLQQGFYDKENNWYCYEFQYKSNAEVSYYYDIGKNQIIINLLIKENDGIFTMTLLLNEKENDICSVRYYYYDGDIGIVCYAFQPYSYNWELLENNYYEDKSSATKHCLDIISENLEFTIGMTLRDMGVYYR